MGVGSDAMTVREGSGGYDLKAESPIVPVGYKQTEVGVIPKDWDVTVLGAISILMTNGFVGTATTHYVQDESGVLYIQGYNVEENSFNFHGIKYVKNAFHQAHLKSCLRGGDLLTVQTGNVGLTTVVTDSLAGSNCHALIITRLNQKLVSPHFLSYYLNSGGGRGRLKLIEIGTTMKHLNVGDMLQFFVPLPPDLEEQRAIATALSDMDALLDGLNRLIAKKRDLKQATMQQLLTGQTRLPGFVGVWKVKRLGEHFTFLRNGVNSRAELTQDDPVKYLHYGDIHACGSAVLNPQSLPSLPSDKSKTLDRLRDGDLVFADASEDLDGVSKSVEIFGTSNTEVVSGLHTIAVRFDKNVLADGFKSYLQFCPAVAGHLRRLAAGTKVYATNRSHIASMEMRLPEIREQTAIATGLSDMDTEIKALEQRRHKTRGVKQAMMQELLTGRTRLL